MRAEESRWQDAKRRDGHAQLLKRGEAGGLAPHLSWISATYDRESVTHLLCLLSCALGVTRVEEHTGCPQPTAIAANPATIIAAATIRLSAWPSDSIRLPIAAPITTLTSRAGAMKLTGACFNARRISR
jgi:hypothetical protein